MRCCLHHALGTQANAGCRPASPALDASRLTSHSRPINHHHILSRNPPLNMALPKALLPSLTPLELEFLSEEVLVEIVPSYSMKPIRLLSVS